MKHAFIGCVLATLAAFAQTPARPSAAKPLEPAGAIFDAFKTHQVVALGEGDHGNEQGAAFRLSLIRDPRFPTTVNDIVVETGNALYQDVMDRFVTGGEVTNESLRKIWQNTTQPFTTFDVPVYEQFFSAVRAVNASLPPSRRLRVLLGDPPVDWDRVTRDDLSLWNRAMSQRDSFPVELIRREVLAKNRRALVIYGDMHLQRRSLDFNYEIIRDPPASPTIVQALESGPSATNVFTIFTNTRGDLVTVQPDVIKWPKPSLALTRGSTVGAADFTVYYTYQADRVLVRDGSFVVIPRENWRNLRMQDQFDAVLYLGRPTDLTIAGLSADLCADPSYIEMRTARFELVGLPPAAADRLRQSCAKALPR